MNPVITYKEYDDLCDASKTLLPGIRYVPGMDEAERISDPDCIGEFASYIIWILETAGDPETEEEAQVIALLNDRMIRNVTFCEQAEESGKEKIRIFEIQEIREAVRNSGFPDNAGVTVEMIRDLPKSFFRYGFGFCLLLSFKNKGYRKLAEVLAKRVDANCCLITNEKTDVRMTEAEWKAFKKAALNVNGERDDWWPSETDIKKYIIPNFRTCLDFIVWLLESPSEASTLNPEADRSRSVLKNLFKERVLIL